LKNWRHINKRINLSIKTKIFVSFFLLALLFVINGIISLNIINNNRKFGKHILTVINPSLRATEDFTNAVVESKTYTTSWVFLRSNVEDKDALKKLHNSDYPNLKLRLNSLAQKWGDKSITDSLSKIYTGFEQLVFIEKKIMASLQSFEDYDDVVAKKESERMLEEEVLPRIKTLTNSLRSINLYEEKIRTKKINELEHSSMVLSMLTSILVVTIICIGTFLSFYFTKIIIGPINKIRNIINDLGKGIISKVNYKTGRDEIGEMVSSVNNLSEKLHNTAAFAAEIGNRNFNSYFEPLGPEDTLGKALVAMRDNIKSSDEKLNQAQHIAHLGNWERDVATGKVYLSDEMLNIFDIDPASFDFNFQSIVKLIHPEDIDYFKNINKKYLQDHQPVAYECRIVTAKGLTKNIFVQSKVVLDTHEEVTGTVGIVQDITERKRAEERLVEERELFRLLIENIPDQIYFKDAQSRFLLCNMPVAANAGYLSTDDLIGKSDADLFQYENARQFYDDEQKLMKSGEPLINQEEYSIDKTGAMHWNLSTKVPIQDATGKIKGLIGISRDITERKKAETELHNSEERYRQIVETAQEGIWMIDENNKTTFVNKKMCEILGYSQNEMMSKELFSFMDEEGKRIAQESIEERKLGGSETIDFKFITKEGAVLWTSLCNSTVRDDRGKYIGALAMVTDITKRKLNEELLQKSEAFLEMKNKELEVKNRELEQFAYVASHDLQEPLRTTSSFAELLQKQYSGKLDEKANQYLSFITHSTDRMKVLIKDLLDYSRIGRKKEFEKIDCNIVLSEVIEDLDKLITDTTATIQAESLPVIYGYSTEIQLLFQNLVMNAIKFRKKDIAPEIKISAQLIKGNWQFTFTDNGIGIDEKHSERIFIIFQRLHTRGEYQGSGIGLSHCKKIVELHGGKIWVNSTPGEGSTFNFTLPSGQPSLTNVRANVPGMYIDIHEDLTNGTQNKFQNAN